MTVPRTPRPPHSTPLRPQQSPTHDLLPEMYSFHRISPVEHGGLADGGRDRLVNTVLRRSVPLSRPQVDPISGRKINLYGVRIGVEHRRHHEPGADHELVSEAGHL